MARDAVPQAQELPQERFLDRAEQRHVRAILAAGQYGAERDQQQFMQIMAGIILPRGNDLGKAGDEFFHGRASTLNPRLVLQLSLVASDSSYLWDDCVEVSHVGRLCKRPCLA